MSRPPLDWQDVAVQRPAKIEMDLWATASRQPAGRATPRALRSRPFGDHQAHGFDALAWAPRAMGFTANIASGFAMALLLVGVAVWENWL